MKRKGFTLIELLAVIVILAIIALIAVPIVLDVIKDSRESSKKRSIEIYGSAVEQAISNAEITGEVVSSGWYTTEDGKTLTQGDKTIEVDYSGSKVVCDVYITSDGDVSLKNCKVNGESIEYTYGEKVYYNGEVVYFNVTTGSKCTSDKAVSTTGTKAGCMKFYAFNYDGGEKVNLILDHNTTAVVAWNTSESNDNGPTTLLEQLQTDTASWIGTETPTNYVNSKYTIDYSSYKARLITAGEIAKIVGNTGWDEITATEHYYFHDNTQTEYKGSAGTNKYAWLFDNTGECTTYGCNVADSSTYGYWTASSLVGEDFIAWVVRSWGSMNVDFEGNYGVRPVIEVLKSKLN